ncbi:hypothetical protein METHPM2_870009 [Pseudomonas sp. PM2]
MVFALEDQVVDARVAVFTPVAAAGAGVQQRAAQAVVGGAAGQQVAGGLEAVVAGGGAGLGLQATFDRRRIWDSPGDEVDDATHVLRAVAHRTAAAHHIHRVHVAHADRREGELRLAVRREGHWDAIHQHCGARRQAWVEPANAEVQRHVVATGAVVVRGVDAGDAVEHIAGLGGALAFECFAADHISGAGVLEHVGLRRITEPVADHVGGLQLQRSGGAGRLQAVGVITLGAGLQAGAFQQFLQALGGAVVARQTRALHTGCHCRTEGHQHAGFTPELIQGRFQGGRRDVVRLGVGCHHRRQCGQAEAGTEQELAQCTGEKRRLLGHKGGPEKEGSRGLSFSVTPGAENGSHLKNTHCRSELARENRQR